MNGTKSNRDFYSAWSSWASSLSDGCALRDSGLAICWMHKNWPMCNQILLDSEVHSLQDFDERIKSAISFASKKGKPWVLNLCNELLSGQNDSDIGRKLESLGFILVGKVTGMEASKLNESKTEPVPLEYVEVDDKSKGEIYGEINALAYNVPRDLGREALSSPDMWTTGNTTGVIGLYKGEPVTCASTVRINRDEAYLAIVATKPEFQKMGLGEAVMRKSIEATFGSNNYNRAILHATPEGKPLYEKMGFKRVADFSLYIQKEFT